MEQWTPLSSKLRLCVFCITLITMVIACSDGLLNFGDGSGGGGGGSGSSASGNLGTKLNGDVLSILVDTNGGGHVYIAGDFTSFDNLSAPRIARLTSDGGLDTGFNPGTGFDRKVNQIIIGNNNTIYAVGDFDSYNGTAASKVARLQTTGSKDASFATLTINSEVTGIALSSTLTNHVYVVGEFTTIGVGAAAYMAKFTSLGDQDTFASGFDENLPAPVKIIRHNIGENFFVVGRFTSYAAAQHNRLLRIESGGQRDIGFANGGPSGANSDVLSIAQNTEGLYIVGAFTSVTIADRALVARIDTLSGSNVAGFNPGGGFNNTSLVVADASFDRTIYVGGSFTSYAGSAAGRLVRISTSGAIDVRFTVSGFNGNVRSLAVDTSNGLLYAGGSFTSYGATVSHNLIRIHTDGRVDSNF